MVSPEAYLYLSSFPIGFHLLLSYHNVEDNNSSPLSDVVSCENTQNFVSYPFIFPEQQDALRNLYFIFAHHQ